MNQANRWTPESRQAQAERMHHDNPRHRHNEATTHTTAAQALDHVTRHLIHFPTQLELDVTT